MNPSRLWILLSLLVLTVVSGLVWQWQWSDTPAQDISAVSTQRIPDYQVERLRLVSMDAAGMPAYHLQADTLVHYPADKWSDLAAPKIRFYQKKALNWDASARQGRVYDQSEDVGLSGNVILSRPAGTAGSTTRLHTEQLTLHTESQIAETQKLARLKADTHQLQGVGMQADLKNGTIRFHSDVKGVHREAH